MGTDNRNIVRANMVQTIELGQCSGRRLCRPSGRPIVSRVCRTGTWPADLGPEGDADHYIVLSITKYPCSSVFRASPYAKSRNGGRLRERKVSGGCSGMTTVSGGTD